MQIGISYSVLLFILHIKNLIINKLNRQIGQQDKNRAKNKLCLYIQKKVCGGVRPAVRKHILTTMKQNNKLLTSSQVSDTILYALRAATRKKIRSLSFEFSDKIFKTELDGEVVRILVNRRSAEEYATGKFLFTAEYSSPKVVNNQKYHFFAVQCDTAQRCHLIPTELCKEFYGTRIEPTRLHNEHGDTLLFYDFSTTDDFDKTDAL